MQMPFEVLHDRPKIAVKLTRDSVAAGDDCDAPHEKSVSVYSFVDPQTFVDQFFAGYLPSVAGIGHSWSVFLNGNRIARITTNDVEPKVSAIRFEQENSIHFQYHSANY